MADKSWPHSGGHHKLSGLYELKKTLGRGHFAVVRLAQHVFTGENVAIKVIDKTKLDKTSMDHLYHEVTCMKLVQHPNVVRLYEVIETSTKLYLILELGDGGDMYDYIMKHDQGLDEDQAKEYFAQILCAISYCHKMHVVHRDLKPENIVFFESRGLVKLTDFGFSNQYDPGKKLSTSCGSLAYSAPEILLGEEYDAQAVDVWSLGVILYMLVCGEAPFNEANDSETLTNIMDCKYTVLDHVDRDCGDLIKRMIIREPSERLDLEDIRNHPWLRDCATLRDDVYNCTPVLTRDLISDTLHLDIVNRMIHGKLAKQEEIEEAINENKYNHITSTYYLLAHRSLEAQRKPSESCLFDEEMEAAPGELLNKTMLPYASNSRLPQISSEHLPPGSKANIPYSSSPPVQAIVIPVSQTGLHGPTLTTHAEEMNEDSSPASSNSSLYYSGHALHLKGDRKMSPPFPREHLTITPRHGFSVAKGGIDTLIEEEERSRSQTTTDDEDDGIMNKQMEEDITCARIINPVQLASQLQRASLQMKRLKKRKSAPVLNEICEENENEAGDVLHRPDLFRKQSNLKFEHRRKHTTSLCGPNERQGACTSADLDEVDMVDVDVFQSSGITSMEDTLPELQMDVITTFGPRKGHVLRKGSLKSSGSETSDDDSESRRTSRSSLHAAVCNFNRSRRDSSDDHDPSNGNGGQNGPIGHKNNGITGLSFGEVNESDAVQQTSSENASTQDAGNKADNNNFNNSVHQNLMAGKTPLHCMPNSNSSTCSQSDALNNTRGRRSGLHQAAPCHHICNIPEKRSKSAESSQSLRSTRNSSRTSSARSSSSSIGYRRGRVLNGRCVKKNSRSTMSDTGLVLRLNNLRSTTIPVSHSTSSVTSLSISLPKANQHNGLDSLQRPLSESNVMDSDTKSRRTAKRQCRSTSLPRPNCYVCNHLSNQRAASCGPLPGRKRQCSSSHSSLVVSIQPCIPESQMSRDIDITINTEAKESNIKRSNISLASSTCSASKYAVDPVNEMVLSPMEEEDSHNASSVTRHGSNIKFFRRSKKSSSLSSSDSLRYSKCNEKSDPPTPTKVERIKMTFLSHIAGDGIFRRKSSSKKSPLTNGRQWFEQGNVKMKSLPDASVFGMFNGDPLQTDSPLLMRKTKPDCCVIM